MKLTEYLRHVLTIKGRCQMMGLIHWLIFIKIVLQAVKRFKKVVIKKEIGKACDKKEEIKKDCKKSSCQ